jgi:hypothetical protein
LGWILFGVFIFNSKIRRRRIVMSDTNNLLEIADGQVFAKFVRDVETITGRKVAIVRLADRMPVTPAGVDSSNAPGVFNGREIYVAFESLRD